ncbi:hypothetical protein [Bradyrhizobium sp. dw_78]|uniref:hypothetical protein n=1 Tax=Bradyrhizobium sp. dw_78 TaxID=2719793 RepID=UPI001BD47D30|nr:hypothetical protein [Bradyrhizobium sp. dw_78]
MITRRIRALVLAALTTAITLSSIAASVAGVPTPVPALPDTERRTSYSITASNCACAVNFAIYGDSTDYQDWVEVWLNGVNVAFNDPTFGWTITSPSGPLANLPRPITNAVLTFTNVQTGTVQIVGARRPRRVSQFNENTGVPARNLNQVLTDIVAMLREVWDKINDVTGRVIRAPAGETLATLPPAANRANMGACFDSSANLTPCIGAPSGSFAAGDGITFTGANPTTISTPTFVPGTGIAFTGTNPTVISAGGSSNGAVLLPSRAAAAATDLHTFGMIQTGGYAQPGDGGGATFKNVGSAAFIDSFVSSETTTNAGAGCTAGTYPGVKATGGDGVGLTATVTISGGAMLAFSISNAGNAYNVNNVLTLGGSGSLGRDLPCTTQPTITITAVTSPLGSFTDAVGNHWQIIADQNTNIRQFGAVQNYTHAGGDAAATDDGPSINAALAFAGYVVYSPDAGGHTNGSVYVPAGASKVCNGLVVPMGVVFRAAGPTSSILKQCDSDGPNVTFVVLGDRAAQLACFGVSIRDMQLFTGTGGAGSGIAMLYTNCAQQNLIYDNVTIYPGDRICLLGDTGYGGAANFSGRNLYCNLYGTTTNPGVVITYGAAYIHLVDTVVESGGPVSGTYGLDITTGGVVDIDGWHSEGLANPIYSFVTGSTIVRLHTVTGGGGGICQNLITKQSGSNAGALIVGGVEPNGCTTTVNNGGTLVTGAIGEDQAF